MPGMMKALWFDVESRYEATRRTIGTDASMLWFDVESRYEATFHQELGLQS